MEKSCKTCVEFDENPNPLYKFEKDGRCYYWGDYVTANKQHCDKWKAKT